jgi:hypothetical protein
MLHHLLLLEVLLYHLPLPLLLLHRIKEQEKREVHFLQN